jgi:hypothetical protein
MSLFDGIENAEIQKRREYVKPGRYVMRIDGLKTGMTRKKLSFFVANMTVVHVVDITAAANDNRGPHRVGDSPSWMTMATWDTFLSTVKGLIYVLAQSAGLAQSESEVDKASIEMAVGDTQPFAGMFLEIDAVNVPKRESADVFTQVRPVRVWTTDEVLGKIPPAVAASLRIQA